jgi:hypothetical protein
MPTDAANLMGMMLQNAKPAKKPAKTPAKPGKKIGRNWL